MTDTWRREFTSRSMPVMLACGIGNIVSMTPVIYLTFSSFLVPVSHDLGWRRSQLSFILVLLSAIGVVFYPLSGRLIDRIGARPTALVGNILFGLAVASLSLLPANPVIGYGLFALVGIAATLPSNVLMSRVVSTWFVTHRGLALGLSGGVAFGIGGVVLPVIAQAMIVGLGWRTAYVGLGAIVIALGLPTFAVLLREAPGFAAVRGHVLPLPGVDRPEALRMPAFWLLLVSVALGAGSVAAVVTHIVPIVGERGAGVGIALGALAALSVSNALWQMGLGIVLDRVSTPRIAGLFMVLGIAGILIMAWSQDPLWLTVGGLLIGFGSGTEYGLLPFCIPRYFGFRAYGELYGYIFAAVMVGQGLLPFLTDLSFEATGSYQSALFSLAGMLCVCGATLVCLPRYPDAPGGDAVPVPYPAAAG